MTYHLKRSACTIYGLLIAVILDSKTDSNDFILLHSVVLTLRQLIVGGRCNKQGGVEENFVVFTT